MTYVMADIHGELDRYIAILDLIRFSESDVLYILGDVIDRSKDSIELLQMIMGQPNVHMIIGNHEELMLTTLGPRNEIGARKTWKENGGSNTYRTMVYILSAEERNRILDFVQNLPDHLEIEVNGQRFYLVHGNYGETRHERLWGRPEPPPTERPLQNATVIVGHTCTYYMNLYCEDYDEDAPWEIFYGPGLIGIDCGCGNDSELRRLACLRLDDMQEFYI